MFDHLEMLRIRILFVVLYENVIAPDTTFLATIGVDPYIVADEVFWQEVDPVRLRAFDAVTAYNVYDWPRAGNAGWAGESTFLADVEGLYARWQKAALAAGVRFVPNAMPGYNDRGVRPTDEHYVIPRRLKPGGPSTGLFERSIALAQRFVDPTVPMVTITSFNEWHEWTQVEPARRGGEPRPGTITVSNSSPFALWMVSNCTSDGPAPRSGRAKSLARADSKPAASTSSPACSWRSRKSR